MSGPSNFEFIARLSEAPATVNGVVKGECSPKAGIVGVLVPADPKSERGKWQPNQSDSDGSFNFLYVAPGEYIVAAIVDGWKLDWSRPEVIAPYLARGVKVIVTKGAREVNLNDAVEAQPVKGPASKTPDSAVSK